MKRKLTLRLIFIALVLVSSFVVGGNAHAATIYLKDIDSGLTSPQGQYRWLDVADQPYSAGYRNSYNYTQAFVEVTYQVTNTGLIGTLTATNLKPNFGYQLKLTGMSGTTSNEDMGLSGRWWQEEWNGSEWTNGQNLNIKGDGSSPNPNDNTYFARRDITDPTSPTGLKYRYTGYLVFEYFITDKNGNAVLNFETNSSYHVLWKTSQRAWTSSDGPLKSGTFDADPSSPAYDGDYPSQTVDIFGEWERLPMGGVFLTPYENFSAQIVLTEESFHGSGGEYAGGWAVAMGGSIGFVEKMGMQLILNGAPYVFVGANFWYGMNLAANNASGDRERLLQELDRFQNMGITNLRIMASSEGPNSAPWRMVPVLQTSPGIYDPDILDGLDFLLYAMKVRNLRAVMVLNNFWQWSGGMAQYVNWNGGGDIPYPPPENGGSWDTYQNYTAGFYSNPDAIDDYQNHIAFLINHVNPYTGLAYKDDPAIMSWELANEPRGLSNAINFNLWIDTTAAFIKSLDPDHLVTTGTEGNTPWPSWNGLDFIDNHDSPDIDYATVHIWPQNWGWYDPANPSGTYPSAEASSRVYLLDHIADAVSLNKPLVLEEFGLARDDGIFDPQTSTVWRDKFFTAMYDEIFNSANSGGPAVGTNFWGWAGEGRPITPYGSYWSPGDPWIGDPPHEKQGWYSIYGSDTTTLFVFSGHASDMDALSCDGQICDDGQFCNGTETCDAVQGCLTGIDPCPGQLCDESNDSCAECLDNTDCDDGIFCNGQEVCSVGICQAGTPVNCDAIAFSYTESTNKVVVTGGTSDTPATFSDFVAADRAGAAELLAATAGAANNTLTYQIRPVEDLAIVVDCVVGAKTAETDFIVITGTDAWGGVQTESLDVTAGNGTYTTTKRFQTITNLDCSDNPAGGGTVWADGTIAVNQGRWGVIWDYGDGQYRVDVTEFTIGNSLTPTFFKSSLESVHFPSYLGNNTTLVTTNAQLDIGELSASNEPKNVSYWNITAGGGGWQQIGFSGTLNIYGSVIQQDVRFGHYWKINNGTYDIQHSQLKGVNGFYGNLKTGTLSGVILSGRDNYGAGFQGILSGNTFENCISFDAQYCATFDYGNAMEVTSLKASDASTSLLRMYAFTGTGVLVNCTELDATDWSFGGSNTGEVQDKYTVNIHVSDKDGDNLSGVTVTCEDQNNSSSTPQGFSVTTDANGDIAEQKVMYRKFEDSGGLSTTTYSPHKFTLSKAGYETLILENITVDSPIVWHLELRDN